MPRISHKDGRLLDNSYDGTLQSTLLSGGLGKLLNGIKPHPHDTPSSNNDEEPIADSLFVGWPPANGSSQASSLELLFEFDRVYNFTTVAINCLNDYTNQIRVFSMASIWFSLDKQQWSESPIRFEYQADNDIKLPRGKFSAW